MIRRYLYVGAAVAFTLATTARADSHGGGNNSLPLSVSIESSSPNIGSVVSAASGDTVFTIAPSSGAVSLKSGGGRRVSSGSAQTTVTVSCGSDSDCSSTHVRVRVGNAGSPSGRAEALRAFTVSMGSASLVSSPTGSNPIDFTIGAIGRSSSKTFYVGMDFPIEDNTSDSTGAAASGFYVYVAASPTVPTSGSTSGRALATVYRPISVSQIGSLNFGSMIKPAVGAGAAAVEPILGLRTVTGGVGLNATTPSRVIYLVSGEGGQSFSINVPDTFVMTKTGGASITVTTSTTADGSQTLSSGLGSSGSFLFGVGGSFPLTSTMATGVYTGQFVVSVQYN